MANYKLRNFVWTGLSLNNKKIEGEITANSLNLARARLMHQNIRIISLYQKKSPLFAFNFHKISSHDMLTFFQQLIFLIEAGVAMDRCLEILSTNQRNATIKHVIISLKKEIESGKSLSASCKKFPTYFNELTCQLIQAGEESGTLDNMMKQISKHLETHHAQINKISHALIYPGFISCVAMSVICFMLLFIVPRFGELFSSMQHPLPAATQFIMKLSYFLSRFGFGILLTIAFFLLFFYKTIASKKFTLFIKLPIIKIFFDKITLSRFLRNLGILLSAGIPITEALKTAASIGYPFNKQLALDIQNQIQSGKQLHVALSHHTIFPLTVIQMIKTGEESGNLDRILVKMADMYDNDINRFLETFNKLIEPAIILILSILIGGLVIALYLPLFNLGSLL